VLFFNDRSYSEDELRNSSGEREREREREQLLQEENSR